MSESTQLFVKVIGRGEPVVFIHGMAGSHRYWYEMAKVMDEKYQLVMPDLLGFGRSPMPRNSDYSYETHIKAILKALVDKKIKYPFTIVGHSMGTLIALKVAAEYPKLVSKVVLVNPVFFDNKKEALDTFNKAYRAPAWLFYGPLCNAACKIVCKPKPSAKLFYRLLYPKLPRQVTDDVPYHTYTSYSRTMRHVIFSQDYQTGFKKVTAPVTILYGKHDKALLKEKLQSIKQKNVKIVELAGGHHLPIHHAKEVAKYI